MARMEGEGTGERKEDGNSASSVWFLTSAGDRNVLFGQGGLGRPGVPCGMFGKRVPLNRNGRCIREAIFGQMNRDPTIINCRDAERHAQGGVV